MLASHLAGIQKQRQGTVRKNRGAAPRAWQGYPQASPLRLCRLGDSPPLPSASPVLAEEYVTLSNEDN